jgi:hypothetical protein
MPLNLAEALERAQTLPGRFQAFQRTLRNLTRVWNFVLRWAGAFLGVFLIHQLFTWASDDPEKAFDRGTFFLEIFELAWDIVGILWNVMADLANAAIVPVWNAFSFYVIEPAITLTLEVFSLIFLRKRWEGLIQEKDFPYGGFTCDSSSVASETWCGRFGAYNSRLQSSDSETIQNSITFGVATARRLSELAGDDDLAVPSIDTEDLIGALDGVSTQSIVMGGSVFDVLFAVLYDVLSTTAVFIFDALFLILRTAFDIIKLLVKSGMLQTLVGIGLDFILIVALEIALPSLFASIDAIICVFQLFLIDTWPEQLECGAPPAPVARAHPFARRASLAPRPQPRKSASRGPTPPPTSGSSTPSRWSSSASPPSWRRRSTAAPAAPSPAAGRSTSASPACPTSSPACRAPAAPPASCASFRNCAPSGSSPPSPYR